MSQPVLIKVYGAFAPASDKLQNGLDAVASLGMGTHTEGEAVSRLGEWLRISFEGIWFPLDELKTFLESFSGAALRGKLDYLDLENWRLTRLEFLNGELRVSSAPLNNVLDYSGF